jgi:predicted class III extradiol MEMO1 family dioxygenase
VAEKLKAEEEMCSELSAKLKLSEETNSKILDDLECKDEQISSLNLSLEVRLPFIRYIFLTASIRRRVYILLCCSSYTIAPIEQL